MSPGHRIDVRVLVVGAGGREHALCAALAADPAVTELFAAPGNPGIGQVASLVPVAATDLRGLGDLAAGRSVDLTVVGPEAPLVDGLADQLASRGLRVFGPGREAARIEGSKSWARALCERHGIPVPWSRQLADPDAAIGLLKGLEPPVVIKADGLAGGKGVTVAADRETAIRAVEECLVRRTFGHAGSSILVEEFLEGREVSAMALVDGDAVLPLPLARDHKRALDGDRGPNTGGMGAYSPVPSVDPRTEAAIHDGILRATAAALAAEGITYRGVLYAGLMLTAEGPKVLEFNCRFGDPETQAVLPRLRSGLADLLAAVAGGRLGGGGRPDWSQGACVAVVLASGGYPGAFVGGVPVDGLAGAAAMEGVRVFHSGTAGSGGRVCTSGGRVLTVSAVGPDLEAARRRAYDAASRIRFQGMQYRRDIAAVGESA